VRRRGRRDHAFRKRHIGSVDHGDPVSLYGIQKLIAIVDLHSDFFAWEERHDYELAQGRREQHVPKETVRRRGLRRADDAWLDHLRPPYIAMTMTTDSPPTADHHSRTTSARLDDGIVIATRGSSDAEPGDASAGSSKG
jgi:hypothetical protein